MRTIPTRLPGPAERAAPIDVINSKFMSGLLEGVDSASNDCDIIRSYMHYSNKWTCDTSKRILLAYISSNVVRCYVWKCNDWFPSRFVLLRILLQLRNTIEMKMKSKRTNRIHLNCLDNNLPFHYWLECPIVSILRLKVIFSSLFNIIVRKSFFYLT